MQSHSAGSNHEESEFQYHLPCTVCGSSDANSMYDDGHTYCFSCNTRTSGEGEPPSSAQVAVKGTPVRLKKRGLSEEDCRKYKIHKDGDVLRFHYTNKRGQVVAAKIKTKDKDFYWDGKNIDNQFFGQNLFPDTGSRLTLYEGELDAVSGYHAMPTWPHMSVPNGAAGAKKDLQKIIELTQGYDEVVFFFDNDSAGIQAAEECAQLLPPGKAKLARLEKYKDASEALSAGDTESIRKAIWDAKTYRPDGIVDAKSLLEIVTKPEPPCAYDYPFEGLNEKVHGIRYGTLTAITAGTGTGKTSFCRQIAAHLLQKGERVGVVELEASNRNTALGLMSCAVGKPLHLGEHDETELQEDFRNTIGSWNLYLFDGFGSFDPDVIYNRIEYLASGLECRVVFLDHLSILLSGLEGDERRMIDTTMTKLRSLVERTGIALFLVSHLRRSNNDRTSHEEGGRVNLSSLRGSHSIAQISDTVIALERDQQADAQRGTTTVRVLKNRYSGETGVASNIAYDLSTCRFTENEITQHGETSFDPTTDF